MAVAIHLTVNFGDCNTSLKWPEVLLTLRWPHCSILMCYWFSWYLIPAYWSLIYSHVTSSTHTNVLLILRWHHPSILMFYWFWWYPRISMCYWFSYDLIPAYQCVIDSHVISFQHINVIDSLVTSFQHTDVLLILVWPYSSILKYCWFSWYLISPY